ncbi:MAG: hypothetical protein H7Y37_02940 [Anaerolineae bacterium]|nr:hypothetical protein [Gloeobacterales cyanobacterium ES-bin-313]
MLALVFGFLFWGMWQFSAEVTFGLVVLSITLLRIIRPTWQRLSTFLHLRLNQYVEWPIWRKVAAVHEAGHVIVAHRLGVTVSGYALTPAASALGQSSGYTQFAAEQFHFDPEKILTNLTVLVSGKACEELIFGKAHGASHDLRQFAQWVAAIDGALVEQGQKALGQAFWQTACEERAKQLLSGQESLVNTVAQNMIHRQPIAAILSKIDASLCEIASSV